MVRKYEQRARADKQRETRQRIVEAAVELHGTLGPAATSLSAVAERAGVQRNTLYRHFADDTSLLLACSSHWNDLHPIPEPTDWAELTDPEARLRHGLGALYDYYEQTEEMTARIVRDAEVDPVTREVSTVRFAEPLAAIRESLTSVWPGDSDARDATIGLALSFHTWRALTRGGGLTSGSSADLMVRLVASAAAAEPVA